MRIELNIERVVLEGMTLNFAQREQLAGALQLELARSLAGGGIAPSLMAGGAVPHLSGTAALGSGDPRVMARSIATGVLGALQP